MGRKYKCWLCWRHYSWNAIECSKAGSAPFQSTTDGSDFYLGVFNPDASSLAYGTFFGGGISAEHVDGGTSRFDKNGNVYQAVCAGCGGSSDFPTSMGAWSTTNNSTNCNLGAFKFDLGNITPAISIPQPWVCIPSSYQFDNLSSGGNVYEWDFGDGNSRTILPQRILIMHWAIRGYVSCFRFVRMLIIRHLHHNN